MPKRQCAVCPLVGAALLLAGCAGSRPEPASAPATGVKPGRSIGAYFGRDGAASKSFQQRQALLEARRRRKDPKRQQKVSRNP